MTLNYESANKISSDLSHSDISCSVIDSMDNGKKDGDFDLYDLCTLIIRICNETNNISKICSIVSKHGISCKMDFIDNKIVLH